MAKKKDSSFEVLVVLAIVAIVAVTGQVLIHYDIEDGIEQVEQQSSDNSLTGFATIDETQGVEFTDVAVRYITINPGTPASGQPFEVVVTLENRGTSTLSTPFYVSLEVKPMPTEDGEEVRPLELEATSSKIIPPGHVAQLSFYTALSAPEGPVRIIASADTTSKLFDSHLGNNQLTKTFVLAE